MPDRRQEILRSAFTLAEMLVVLVILAVLTFVAVESLRPVAGQARFEATRTTLENIRQAIVSQGPTNDSAGVRGFVADVGRPPGSLQELIDPTGFTPFGLHNGSTIASGSGINYSGLQVPAGWRGPYLLPPPGGTLPQHAYRDGWGEVLTVEQLGDGSLRIKSAKEPRLAAGETVYINDIGVEIYANDFRPRMITGRLTRPGSSSPMPPSELTGWGISLLGPDSSPMSAGIPMAIEVALPDRTDANQELTYTLDVSALSCGPRVLVATRGGAVVGRPIYVHLKPGATHTIDLNLGPP